MSEQLPADDLRVARAAHDAFFSAMAAWMPDGALPDFDKQSIQIQKGWLAAARANR